MERALRSVEGGTEALVKTKRKLAEFCHITSDLMTRVREWALTSISMNLLI